MWQLWYTATWGRPMLCQLFSALTETATPSLEVVQQYPLPSYGFFTADTWRFTEIWTFEPETLTFDLLILNIWGVSAVTRSNFTKSEWNRAIRSSVTVMSIYDLMNLNQCITRCVPHWNNFHQVWSQSTYTFRTYNIFTADTLCNTATLISDLERTQYIGCQVV